MVQQTRTLYVIGCEVARLGSHRIELVQGIDVAKQHDEHLKSVACAPDGEVVTCLVGGYGQVEKGLDEAHIVGLETGPALEIEAMNLRKVGAELGLVTQEGNRDDLDPSLSEPSNTLFGNIGSRNRPDLVCFRHGWNADTKYHDALSLLGGEEIDGDDRENNAEPSLYV
jgi:hypothetical protein